jgi:hypothetical protein
VLPYHRGVLRPSSLPHARAGLAARVAAWLAVGLAAGVLAVSGVLTASPAMAASGDDSATGSAASASSASRSAVQSQPLVPKIRSITPDYVPDKGPIVIRGTVTNASDHAWTAINVHGFMGATPITTSAELAAAVHVPVDADVGHRITVPGTFASIPRLKPGRTASFVIRLPQRTLPVSSPGVYWFGVHVLGDDGQGGARVAVGRDRTFLSYVPNSAIPGDAQEDAALLVPVRTGVVRGPDGTIVDPDSWGQSLRSGPLHDIVATGLAAGGRPLTWLVDPAVPDVVRRIARDNPALTLSAPGDQGDQTDSPSASASASGSASSATGGTSLAPPSAATRRVARSWLRQLHTLLGSDTGETLGLPYGDLAVESASTYDRTLLRSAYQRTARVLRGWGLSAGAVDAPPDGRTTPDALTALPRNTDVLLADTGVVRDTHTVNQVAGRRAVLSSTATEQGGPGPAYPRSPVALRQRILAEAALRLLGDREPLVVELPPGLQSHIRDSFFSGLDVPWLRLTTLDGAAAVPPAPLDATRLRQPAPDEPRLGPRLYRTADQLLADGSTLQAVLTDNHDLSARLFQAVAGNASYAAQREPLLALSRMRVIARWVRANLDHIGLAAPPSVTLASTSGRFSVLVSNDLGVPVTIRVEAHSDSHLRITGGEKVKLPPHGRSTVLLDASTHQRGVHSVMLELTTTDGRPLGASEQFPMRSEQVSGLIWVIIGAGVALLFAAIAVRLTRRVLRARAARRTAS